MKSLRIYLLILILALLAWSCSQDSKAEDSNSKTNPGLPVVTKALQKTAFEEYLNLTGVVKARNQIKVVAEESGIVVEMQHDKGAMVQQGAVLARIENKVLQASYQEARAARDQAQLDFNSSKVLAEKNAISENEFEKSRLNLERAQAAYELAKARYDKLTLRAPIAGYVNARYFDMGAYISPGSPMYEIVDNGRLKVSAGVAERFMRFIDKGSNVQLTFDAYPDLVINSDITFVSRSIDPQSRTFQIETEFSNVDNRLAPEMIANVRLLKQKFSDGIVIPIDALIDSEKGRYVFLADQNVAKKKIINIEAFHNDSVLVSGLSAGQELVVTGQRELTEGDTLNIITE